MTWSSDWSTPVSAPATSARTASAWIPDELAMRPAAQSSVPVSPEAERAAQETRAAMERQAELDESFDRGFEEGRRAALESESKRVDDALSSLAQVASRISAGQSAWLQDARENICALAVGVARHVIGRELRGDAHAIVDLARRALLQFPVDEPVRVFIHPQDLSVITAASASDGIHIAPGRQVEWEADEKVTPGGCVVEGRLRVVDGRIDHALERIYQKLIDD
jgi:flagellar assembly protein FliH